ncbi:hypothetical protein ASF79_02900 [Agreia sp. Leaf335]|uniref:DUF1707 SHOCT-like domain-containing protein n=1 Tax=Agreia sp. Leaf335 TaxID=1736340 RepID=UPI0006F24997|nr:DUF1707 domain-containing protein [Agreia sp. Leaf335]KQR24181.1 hypothetical protein ASF79_02900 [Agreia sp. Leaf335]
MSIPDYSGNPSYRLSTAERDRAVTELRQHVAEGRLTEAEFAERSKAARNAVTRGDLAPLFDDLPATTFPASVGEVARSATVPAPTPAPAPTTPAAPASAPTAYADPRPTDDIPVYGAPEVERVAPQATTPAFQHPAARATEGWKDPQAKEPSRVAATVMAIVPFVSLALFFVTGSGFGWSYSWLWFTLIPITGIIVYGPNGKPDRKRKR